MGAERRQGKTKEAAARVHREARWDPRDEMEADMDTKGVKKESKLETLEMMKIELPLQRELNPAC